MVVAPWATAFEESNTFSAPKQGKVRPDKFQKPAITPYVVVGITGTRWNGLAFFGLTRI